MRTRVRSPPIMTAPPWRATVRYRRLSSARKPVGDLDPVDPARSGRGVRRLPVQSCFIQPRVAGILRAASPSASIWRTPCTSSGVGEMVAVRGDADRPRHRLPQLYREAGCPGGVCRHVPAPAPLLMHKWYFDELYDVIFVRPAMVLGRFFWKRGDEARSSIASGRMARPMRSASATASLRGCSRVMSIAMPSSCCSA